MKSEFLQKLLLITLATSVVGFGLGFGAVSANSYFGSQVESLNTKYEEEIDSFMEDHSYVNGKMHQYLNYELHPQLDKEAEQYYQEALAKWKENQETLSSEEKEILDNAYKNALIQIKKNIDEKFNEYGGY